MVQIPFEDTYVYVRQDIYALMSYSTLVQLGHRSFIIFENILKENKLPGLVTKYVCTYIALYIYSSNGIIIPIL